MTLLVIWSSTVVSTGYPAAKGERRKTGYQISDLVGREDMLTADLPGGWKQRVFWGSGNARTQNLVSRRADLWRRSSSTETILAVNSFSVKAWRCW